MTHQSTINLIDKLGEGFDKDVHIWHDELLELLKVIEHTCSCILLHA